MCSRQARPGQRPGDNNSAKGQTEFEITLASGLCLRGLHWGEGAPVRVLALHGWLDNAHSFLPLAGFLPPAIDLVALDQCGHGRSDHRPAGNWYHLMDFVWEAGETARLMGWQQYHLLGHSLGGAVACLLAAACPERVRSLTLIEGLGPLAGRPAQSLGRLRQAWQELAHSNNDRLRLHDSPATAAAARLARNRMKKSSAGLLMERGLRDTGNGWQWRSDPRLRITSAVRFGEPEILHILRGIECPVLQLLPDPPSPLMPEAAMQRRRAVVKNYREVRLPGYHHLHMDHPEPCAKALFEHILSHAAPD